MFTLLSLAIVSSCSLISCEWVQISQSPRTSHGISLNTSVLLKNAEIQIFDHSKYTDLFSDLNPKLDFVEVNNSFINNYHKNPSNDHSTTKSPVFSEVRPLRTEKESKKNEPKKKPLPKVSETRMIVLKPFSFSEILKFFRHMEQSFSIESSEGIQQKTEFLKDFQNGILIDIGRRLKLLLSSGAFRQKEIRIKRSPPSHEMDFPSAETALMTISFLTLAVFLIKLVLQVISTIKSKHIALNTLATSTSPIKIIKANLNARKLSLPTMLTTDDLQTVTETLNNIGNNVKP